MSLKLVKGSTDVTRYIFIEDSSSSVGAGLTGLVFNSAGLIASQARPLAARVAIALATQTVTGAHSDGGFVEIDAANMPGIYRLDLPDAVCAAGVVSVLIHLQGAADMTPVSLEIQLTDIDLNDGRLADQVWDEPLTGATHNDATSSGKRLRQLGEETLTYEGGAVWLDTVNGTAGTVSFENGTVGLPSDTLADALIIAGNLGLSVLHVVTGSTVTLSASIAGFRIRGTGWTLNLNGKSIVACHIEGATVSGVASGVGTDQVFEHCEMNATSHIKGTHLLDCGIMATQTLVEAGAHFWVHCHSGVAGAAAPIMDFGTVGSSDVHIRHYSGGVQIESMGDTGTDTIGVEGQGQVIEGTCTGGIVTVRGAFTITGFTNLTLSDVARLDVEAIAGQVWNQILTGAMHNITNSAGKRVRQIHGSLGYEGGAVYVDTVNGTAGTTNYENGTISLPSLTLADARTIADSLGFKIIHFYSGSSVTLAQAFQGYAFIGVGYTVALGGQDIANSTFVGAEISGIGVGVGTQVFEKCLLGDVTLPADTHLLESALMGTITLGAAGDYFIARCHSAIAGTATPALDFTVSGLSQNLNMRSYSGGIELLNMGQAGTDAASIEGMGQVVINANCIGGTLHIRGLFELTDNGAVTINDDARFDVAKIWADKTGPNGADLTSIKAEVVDAIAELGIGAPSATPTLAKAVMLLYMMARNNYQATDAQRSVLNDAGTVIAEAVLSDDGTTTTRGKLEAP